MSTKSNTKNQIICYHCGDFCKDESIAIEDKYFCCTGCKTVYEILNQGELCTYYNFQENPGISPKNFEAKKFDYLDDTTTINKLLDFSDDKISKITFFIPQMHCSSCIWLLENLFKLNHAITSSTVNFVRKELTVKFLNQKISLKDVVVLISSIGYEPQINLDSAEKKIETKTNKTLYYKVGVAGFCFGNIMMFSFPEYFSITTADSLLKSFFNYLNLILSLPVFFYSASDYFVSAYKGLQKKIINIDVPLSMGILVLFLRSVYELLILNQAGYFDSLAGLVFFLLIGKILQEKTYDAMNFERDYKAYFPLSVTIKQNEIEKSIPVANLMVGNRIIIRQNEIVPADAILMNGDGLIDYSFVSGESHPIHKVSGEMIYAGGRQKSGLIELEVIKEVSQSYLTQLWNNDTFNKKTESEFTNFSNTVSKYFTIVILLIAFAAAAFWFSISSSIAINVFTSVLIVACPCALALSTPFTLGNTMRIFGRNKFYLKNAAVVEVMAKINSIVFDKTGTITESGKSDIIYTGRILNPTEQKCIKSLVRGSTHPLSKKIFDSIDGDDYFPVTRFNEPTGKGIEGVVYGNIIKIGSADFVNLKLKETEIDIIKTRVFVSINSEVVGNFTISNSYREGIDKVVKNLSDEYQLSLLSGDNNGEKENLLKIFNSDSQLHFKQSPEDKLNFIKKLQSDKRKVLMIGDGLNDAGALSQSDVGISVTDDISNFTPACDAIIDSGQLKNIAAFLKFSKSSLKIIHLNFLISFFYNLVGLSFAINGMLSPLIAAVLMPISSISVVLVATLATNLIAKKRGLLSL
ncbi:MAG: heavy metal translocating P-type ATPase metal-binding domain-containing protein [Ignavibacteriaceae bacterium]|nr:heavy metal translocating P-type ATPase metal-binding domain-containing protein [Ignavibacterium sp.]MCC6254548.1 heavy metal translocating P-type ATPase metal-binding domain-containing protein [Ignavibacteriaceae bacterium]HRN26875.1 heavy metal translocating P-type ATPase metal-binding domain-containing protein [Ignavibacteriaceae bacterium]HRP92655.1 heavy metal translocating P-type ATPase metal-binding domain-containing protein [Ignavibacteriaceae bacterium]HRQ54493.1 heavy metal translo